MTNQPTKDDVQIAFDSLEHVFLRYKSSKAHESNQHPIGSPNRVESDLSEVEKAHLAVLQSKLQAAISKQHLHASAENAMSSDRLGRKLFWLNIVVAVLSAVVATSAVLELFQ